MLQNKPDPNQEDLGFLREMIEAVKADTPEEQEYQSVRRELLQKLSTNPKENLIMRTIRQSIGAKVRWVAVTGLAALVILMVLVFNPAGGDLQKVYASVVEQLRNATTVSFKAAWYFSENEPPTYIEMAYREPGIQRISMIHNDARIIEILDTSQDQGIILQPDGKTWFKMDLSKMKSVERERLGLIDLICEEIKTLPDKANKILEERDVEGRSVRGFQVDGQTIWIDVKTQELAFVEKQFGGTRMVMTDFQIDPVELDESKFSLTPPEDYTFIDVSTSFDVSGSGEQDLIDYLRIAARIIKGRVFPATVNPMEIASLGKEGKIDESGFEEFGNEQEALSAFVNACQRAVTFVMKMRPENDWHYAGKGVKFGDSDTAIAWWKISGSKTYRVIWGDLSVENISAEELSQIIRNR